MSSKLPSRTSSAGDIDRFLTDVKQRKRQSTASDSGKLLFAIDATQSRQPTWDTASHLQARMFKAVQSVGSLQVQLCYFRGFDEFKATPWLASSDALLRTMTGVRCLAGQTQIGRVLRHALAESRRGRINAVVYIGDACEEHSKRLADLAGQLGVRKTPVFVFQEGSDARTARVFENIASLSGGAYCRFDSGSADLLADLLSAVAVYASGGRQALEKLSKEVPRLSQLTKQLK